jgi:hypothetical protein
VTELTRRDLVRAGGADLVQPWITAAGAPAKTALQTMTYWDMQRMFESAEAERHAFGEVSSGGTRC